MLLTFIVKDHAGQVLAYVYFEEASAVRSSSTEDQITGGGRLRQEAPEEGSLVPSDVPDGLTNINGSVAAQFENSDDHRHL